MLVGEGVVGAAYVARLRDRAAIAKGLQEGCSLRRTAGSDHGGSVSVVSREIRRNGGSVGISPCGS